MRQWQLLICSCAAFALGEKQDIWDESRLFDQIFAEYDAKTAPFANNCTGEPFKYKIGIATIVQERIILYCKGAILVRNRTEFHF